MTVGVPFMLATATEKIIHGAGTNHMFPKLLQDLGEGRVWSVI